MELVGEGEVERLEYGLGLEAAAPHPLAQVRGQPLQQRLVLLLHEQTEEIGRHVALEAQGGARLAAARRHFLVAQRVADAGNHAHKGLHLRVGTLEGGGEGDVGEGVVGAVPAKL